MEGNNIATAGGAIGAAAEPAEATEPNNQTGQNNTQASAGRMFTEEEMAAEVDRRVNQAQMKWSASLEEKLNAARSEGEKLAKMTADDRAKAQFQSEKEAFESERARYETERMEFEATKLLSEQHLPIRFAKMCVGKSAEETKSNIDALKAAWSEALQDAVNERMKGATPKTGGAALVTKEEFAGMNYTERLKLFRENPERYRALQGE